MTAVQPTERQLNRCQEHIRQTAPKASAVLTTTGVFSGAAGVA